MEVYWGFAQRLPNQAIHTSPGTFFLKSFLRGALEIYWGFAQRLPSRVSSSLVTVCGLHWQFAERFAVRG